MLCNQLYCKGLTVFVKTCLQSSMSCTQTRKPVSTFALAHRLQQLLLYTRFLGCWDTSHLERQLVPTSLSEYMAPHHQTSRQLTGMYFAKDVSSFHHGFHLPVGIGHPCAVLLSSAVASGARIAGQSALPSTGGQLCPRLAGHSPWSLRSRVFFHPLQHLPPQHACVLVGHSSGFCWGNWEHSHLIHSASNIL